MSSVKLDLNRSGKADLNPRVLDRAFGSLLLVVECWWLLRYDNAVALGSEWCFIVFIVGIVMVVAALGVIRSYEWAFAACFQFFTLASLVGIAAAISSDEAIGIRLLQPVVPAGIAGYCRWRVWHGDFG